MATDSDTHGTVGLRVALEPMGGLTPHADLGWQHAFNVVQTGQTLTFQSLSQSFAVLGAPLASDAAAARVGFDISLSPAAKFSVEFGSSCASRVQNNAIRGRLEWKF